MSTTARKRRPARQHHPASDSLRVELERGDTIFEEAVAPADADDVEIEGVTTDDDEAGAPAVFGPDDTGGAIVHAIEMCSTQIRALDQQVDELRAMHDTLQQQVEALHQAGATLREGLMHVQQQFVGAGAVTPGASLERFDERIRRVENAVARSRKHF